jgi:hypothetical protein
MPLKPPRKRRQRALLPHAPQFTTNSLRLLFARVLRSRWATPGDAELEELARILEIWRQHYLAEQNVLSPRRESQHRIRAALKTLTETLPKLKQINETCYAAAVRELAAVRILTVLEKRLAEINEAVSCITRIEQSSFLVEAGLGARDWKWLADVLPQDFCNAMKRSNPKFTGGFGHDGPVARFVAAVAPMLTGEHPTAGSVATQLKVRRKAGK